MITSRINLTTKEVNLRLVCCLRILLSLHKLYCHNVQTWMKNSWASLTVKEYTLLVADKFILCMREVLALHLKMGILSVNQSSLNNQ
jgi:hypothetical protein